MSETDRRIIFSVICNRSRRRELLRIGEATMGISFFPESQPIFSAQETARKVIVGQLMAGAAASNEALKKIQDEIESRKMGVSPVQRIDLKRFGGVGGLRRFLSGRNQIVRM